MSVSTDHRTPGFCRIVFGRFGDVKHTSHFKWMVDGDGMYGATFINGWAICHCNNQFCAGGTRVS